MTRRLDGLALFAAFTLLLTSTGCAHSPPAPVGPQLSKADMKFKSVYIEDFTIAPAGVAENEPTPHVRTAQASCMDTLTRSGLFDAVELPSPSGPREGAIVARAELTSLRIVGGAARFWIGAFAGRSDMRFQVTLIDAAS